MNLQILKENSLFYKIIGVFVCMLVISVGTMMIMTMQVMQQRFIDVYTQQTRILMNQVYEQFDSLSEDMNSALMQCPGMKACQEYLTRTDLSLQEETDLVYTVSLAFKNSSILNEGIEGTLLLFGTNGRTLVNTDSVRWADLDTILENPDIQEAAKTPDVTSYIYLNEGYITKLKDTPCFAAVRFLSKNSEIYAMEILMIAMEDFTRVFDSVIDGKISLVDVISKDGQILSSNSPTLNGTWNPALSGQIEQMLDQNITSLTTRSQTTLIKKLPFFRSYLVTTLYHSILYESVSDWPLLLMYLAVLLILASLMVYFIIRSSMEPIRNLIKKMKRAGSGNFEPVLSIQGSGEIRDLELSYNRMLQDLQDYIDKLMELQEQKRLSEIHALQLQINPHFMYNTLASFKFLLWQKKYRQLEESLDSFIALLRNTLGDKREQIRLQDEVDTLRHYVQILKMRFGENIQVNYHIDPRTLEMQVPKLILQPFVENAFFHAFPDQKEGTIQVCSRIRKDELILEIIDNGMGMKSPMSNASPHEKGDFFTGLGIHNVDERIKLIYGSEYGIQVSSMPGQGTMITITLPACSEPENKNAENTENR